NATSTDPAHPMSGALLALRAGDGHQLQRTEVGALASWPVVDGDTISVGAEHLKRTSGFSKEVYALNRGDGSVRWKTEIATTKTISDTLVLSGGRLFIGASQLCFDTCNAAYLFALDCLRPWPSREAASSSSLRCRPPTPCRLRAHTSTWSR